MKKLLMGLLALLGVASVLSLTGCGEKKTAFADANSDQELNPGVEYADYDFIDPSRFFELDYRGEYVEPESVPGKLDLSGDGAKGESSSVIPGLRSLGDYKTTYNTKRMSLSEYLAAKEKQKKGPRKITVSNANRPQSSSAEQSAPEETSSATAKSQESSSSQPETEEGALIVRDWGPSYQVPGEMQRPQFYVEFNHPVKSLKALDDQDKINKDAKKVFTITPEVKGNYRWMGTKNLSFECDDALDPCISYTITVNKDLKSIGGNSLSGRSEFTTKTSPARVVDYQPGVSKERSYVNYSSDAGLPVETAKYCKIFFNYYFTSEDVYSRLSLQNGGSFSIEGDFEKNDKVRVSNDKKRTNAWYITINDQLENNSTISFVFDNGERKKSFSYRTLIPFICTSAREYTGNGYGNAVRFEFNQPVDESTILTAISSTAQELSRENISCWNKTLTIQYLKGKPGDYTDVTLNSTLKNVYGFELTNGPQKVSFKTRDYQGYANFIESGNVIMESQFPHKLVFEYMNAEEGAYRAGKTDDPLKEISWRERFSCGDYGSKYIKTGTRNTKQFTEVDLEPYLVNGKGAVRFEADIKVRERNWRGEEELNSRKNYLNVQVTDLAATARFGINKAVVLVRSMEHNTPVEGASVKITNRHNYLNTAPVLTDKEGLAVINFTKEDQLTFRDWEDQSSVVVEIESAGDKVIFKPSSHSSWRSGISTDNIHGALKKYQRTFMFCDRGLYKPGETITFKGIDRDKELGSYVSYNGPYKVVLEQRSWRGNTTYSSLTGLTSASGSFYGSFQLPSNLKPGEYCITYQRNADEQKSRQLYFTVAYFEPLKFQASVEIKNKTAYAGDLLNADIKASYLAGGSLAGASYSTTWYTEPAYFSTNNRELKGYTFGIYNEYDYRRSISESEGSLTKDGKAKESVIAQLNHNIPYNFYCETYITDVSNQRIAAKASKMVHPALFYVGIGRHKTQRGFAKSGDSIEIPYALVDADGFVSENTKKVRGNLSYTLSREYWTYSYQDSVNNSVYAHWEKHTDIEDTDSVSPSTKGVIKITPKHAGWYTLRVSGNDIKDRTAVTDYNFYVTGSDACWFDSSSSDELKLTPDQNLYNPGDTAHILLESPLPKGDYLITVEREGIFTEEVRHIDQSCDVIDVKIARNYVPVVYVSVSSYSVRSGAPTHEYGERDMDKPKGYYGVTALNVNARVRAFSVKAETDKKVYRPGDTATVTLYATKGGKPVSGAELTCFAADRAVLDLINYHVPNPIDFFYNKYDFALRVRGGDSRNYLMDPVTYSIKNLQGGDASEEKDENERKDFRPTAFFEPQLITDEEGKVSFTFKVPDNLSTFRLTAFGVKEELLALQEDEFAVQNPVNVQSVQPRRLRVRDTAECGVMITNLDNVAHDVTVSISTRDPKQYESDTKDGLTTVIGKASIDGKDRHTVKVAAGGTTVVYFDVSAEKAGNTEIVYKVESEVLKETLISKILIEQTYCFETVSLKGATEYADNGTKLSKELLVIPGWAKDGEGSLKVSLDATQLGLLGGAVNYVFEYPYGCMEQQSSRIIPLVSFDKYIEIFGLNNKVENPHSVVVKFFNEWKDVQHSNGGFPYWPRDSKHENTYVSTRIAHIYAMARKRGYTSSELAINIENLKRYIKRNISKESDLTKAYACYVFSLLGDSSLESTISQLKEAAYDDLDIAAYLGLSWLNKGTAAGRENAKEYHSYIRSYLRPELRGVDITQPANTRWYWYRHYTGQNALILQFFVQMNPTDEMVDRLLFTLLQDQRDGYWQSTITTAKVLEAIHALIQERKLDTTDFVAKAEIMQKEILSAKFKGVAAKSTDKTVGFKEEILKSLPRDKDIELNFSATGTGTLYYAADMKYALPDEIQNKRSEGIDVSYKLSELNSEKEIDTGSMIIPLETGKTYKVAVTVSSTKDRQYLALRVPIPSGAEILDSTFVTSGSEATAHTTNDHGYWWSTWSNQSILDNEIQYFWDDFNEGVRTVEFTFRTARRGVYPVTPVLAECMYEPEIFGRTDGYLYTIK